MVDKRRWLITGGCGFIGKTLVKALLDNNEASYIRVFDNLSVGTREDLAAYCDFEEVALEDLRDFLPPKNGEAPVQFVVGDIKNADQASKVCEGIDVVAHLAANTGVGPSVEDPRGDMEANVIGTLNMLEGSRHAEVKRFVFASSGAPVGEVEPPIHEEIAPHPVSPYGASKLGGEGYCSAYYRTFGLETVILRFSNVYGPGSSHKSSVVAKFIRQALNGETLEIYGDGNQTRDFIYIDDLVRAIQRASSAKKAAGDLFQIATNVETTVSEIIDMLITILASRGINRIKVVHGEMRLGDVKRNYSNTNKAAKFLNWKAKVSLERGVEATVAGFIQ